MESVNKILEKQQQYLKYYFEHVDQEVLEKVVDACAQVKGLIILTGVGKSGIIAEKIAMTLVSTGTKALYLSPINFLHGDLGIFSPDDLLIMISRSGKTEELLEQIPFIKQKGTPIIAVVSTHSALIAKHADLTMILPVEKELCPFDLAPTTSTTVQLLFGDLLTVALMTRKRFSMEDYALNHPAGAIGRKMTITVEDLMFQKEHIPLCSPDDKLVDVLVELSNKKCGALLIVSKEGKLQGVFTDGDLRRTLQKEGVKAFELTMGKLMSKNPITVSKEDLASEALKVMQQDPKKFVAVVPVLEESKVVGILRMHDIVQAGVV